MQSRDERVSSSAISDRYQSLRSFYFAGAVFAVAAVLALQLDLSVLNFLRQARIAGELRKLIMFSEVFAHGLGVSAILATIMVLDPHRLSGLPRMLVCTFGSGMIVNLIKILVGRWRPRDLEFGGVEDTFAGWIPTVRVGDLGAMFDSSIQSFPSGHAATAFGFAVVLGFYYPRGRWLFVAFAALASVQRLYERAHFLSDTLAGAAIGCVVAALCCDSAWWGGWFDRFHGPTTSCNSG